jgi:hypothetical protein
MKYRLKSFEVEAFHVPCPLEVQGSTVSTGDWLVSMDGGVTVFTEEDFQKKFEEVPAAVEDLGPVLRRYKGRRFSDTGGTIDDYELAFKKDPSPTPKRRAAALEPKPAKQGKRSGPTLADRIEKILRAGAASLDRIVVLLQADVPTVTKGSAYATLYSNKIKRGWIFDDDRGVWRFPAGKVAGA